MKDAYDKAQEAKRQAGISERDSKSQNDVSKQSVKEDNSIIKQLLKKEIETVVNYNLSVDQLKIIIANDLKVDINNIEINFDIADSGDDGLGGYNRKYVKGIKITTKNEKK